MCYYLCVLRWLMRPILALNCLLQIEQEVWGRKLCRWCLSSDFPLRTFLVGFAQTPHKLGGIPIGSSITSPFCLTCQQETARLFYFWFLPFSRILRTGYRASVYCNTFSWEQSPGDAYFFAILDNVFRQCNNGIPFWTMFFHNAIMASRRFDCHIKCMSPIQSKRLCAFDHIWSTSDRAGVFSNLQA